MRRPWPTGGLSRQKQTTTCSVCCPNRNQNIRTCSGMPFTPWSCQCLRQPQLLIRVLIATMVL